MTTGTATKVDGVARSFEELAADVPLTAEDERSLSGDDDGPPQQASPTETPEWVVLPPGLALPPGRQVYFVKFRASWTDRPDKGERQCVLWNLTEADEKFALKRTRGEPMRAADELAKQMIRCIDGKRVDWVALKPEAFWDEIGSGCRQLLKNHYAKTHLLGAEDTADFFANCIAVRTAQP